MTTTWSDCKERGKLAFNQQNYRAAVESYQQAIDLYSTTMHTQQHPDVDQALLYGNLAACFLQLGHTPQAIHSARQAIALHPHYAKAHVRLASALLLQGGHSNEACQALQTAVRYDPHQTMARRMLLAELRARDHPSPQSTRTEQHHVEDTTTMTTGGGSSHHGEWEWIDSPNNVADVPLPQPQAAFVFPPATVEDDIPLLERVQAHYQGWPWYSKTLLFWVGVYVVLYLSFGSGVETDGIAVHPYKRESYSTPPPSTYPRANRDPPVSRTHDSFHDDDDDTRQPPPPPPQRKRKPKKRSFQYKRHYNNDMLQNGTGLGVVMVIGLVLLYSRVTGTSPWVAMGIVLMQNGHYGRRPMMGRHRPMMGHRRRQRGWW